MKNIIFVLAMFLVLSVGCTSTEKQNAAINTITTSTLEGTSTSTSQNIGPESTLNSIVTPPLKSTNLSKLVSISDCENTNCSDCNAKKAKCYYEALIQGKHDSCHEIFEIQKTTDVRYMAMQCTYAKMIIDKNVSACESLANSGDIVYKVYGRYCLAIITKNTSVCHDLPTNEAEWICKLLAGEGTCHIDDYPGYSSYSCQGVYALWTFNPLACDQISDISGRSYCYCYYCSQLGSQETCDEFSGAVGVNVCEEAKKIKK